MAAGQATEVDEFVQGPAPRRLAIASAVGYRSTGVTQEIHRGLPSHYLTVIFSLDGPVVTGESASARREGTTRATDVVLGGLHTSPAYVFQPEAQEGIQLALHPLAARALLGTPSSGLDGLAIEGEDVLGRGVRALHQHLTATPDWDDRFRAVLDYLSTRARLAPDTARPRREVAAAWQWMVRRGGTGRMDDLSAYVAMSGRQLSTLFNAEVGMSPKGVNRLIRFDAAVGRVRMLCMRPGSSTLTGIAELSGYFDHAHLVRDFHEFVGCSPTAWMDEELRNIQAGGRHGGKD